MRAALRHGVSESSLHYVSTSTGDGLTTRIVGDVNRTSGTQTIVVTGRAKGSMVIELVGHEAYFRGDATAIEVLIGLTRPEASAAAGRWISVVPADPAYGSTAAALTVGSVISEITLTPPITGGRSTVVGGRTVVQVAGTWVGDGITAQNHATGKLEVTGDVTPLPLSFSGVVPATPQATRFVNNIAVSGWGEAVQVTPPSSSTPLALITGNAPTTTQPPTVV